MNEGVFSVALSTPAGEWGALYKLSRKYQRSDEVKVIATAALDLLRRYLERKPMFAHYAFLEKVLPAALHHRWQLRGAYRCPAPIRVKPSPRWRQPGGQESIFNTFNIQLFPIF